jgi:chitodextrinase
MLGPAALAAPQDRKAPTAPTNLTVTGTTSYSVSLAWGASTDNSGTFSYRVTNKGTGQSVALPQTQTSFTYTLDLQPQLTYSFYVQAVDAAGNWSKASNTVSATLPRDNQPPGTPQISLTDAGPTHLSLVWSVEDDDATHVWLLFMNGSVLYSGSNTSMIVAPLTPATSYTFAVQARDSGGNWSPVSAPLVVSTEASDPLDTTPPTTPAMWGGEIGPCEVMFFWSASSDDVTPPDFIVYRLYVNGIFAQGTTLGRTQAIEYGTFDGTNVFELIAVDEAGNASAPAVASIDLFGCIPPQ